MEKRTTMSDPDSSGVYEKRSQEIADQMRKYLVALNTGGIGGSIALVGAMNDSDPEWVVFPIGLFVIGLVLSAFSLILAKHKALRRRDATAVGDPLPNFTAWRYRNQSWEGAALVTFILAVILELGLLADTVF